MRCNNQCNLFIVFDKKNMLYYNTIIRVTMIWLKAGNHDIELKVMQHSVQLIFS